MEPVYLVADGGVEIRKVNFGGGDKEGALCLFVFVFVFFFWGGEGRTGESVTMSQKPTLSNNRLPFDVKLHITDKPIKIENVIF